MAGSKVPRPEAAAIGRRIAEIRVTRDMSVAELARQMGVRVQSVQQWESGQTTPKSERIAKLARVLNCSPWALTHDTAPGDDLWNGTEQIPMPEFRKVPLISWVQAGHWQEATMLDEPTAVEDHVLSRFTVTPSAFALRVRGDSMEPPFPEGTIIIVDPRMQAFDGDFVVVTLDGSGEATFKKLVIDAGRQILAPLNKRYPVIVPDRPATICGVVVESYQRHK